MTDKNFVSTAIIGAGLAGLSTALALSARGLPVTLYDKGRGPGGRLSARRAGDWRFDHGGQFVTVRDPGFRTVMADLLADGHAAAWDSHIVRLSPDGGVEPHRVERFVGTPGMNGIIQGLIARLPDSARPRFGARVTAISGVAGHWWLVMEDGTSEGPFARVVLAMPSVQAADLLRPVAPALAGRTDAAVMAPCWALMLGFDQMVTLPWDAAFIAGAGGDDRPLSWIAHDGAKPGRGNRAGFVAHAAPDWSARHLEEAADQVGPALLSAFRAVTGIAAEPAFLAAHRWRYALPTVPLAEGFLWDAKLGIGACGDWCLDARAEAAFVSGARLAAIMGDV
ncbi:NAD(P)/FAD-dependent oxidoreductase [Niveispirillum sp.]|uniref:NAD(P)/FAD-dependent oxidoreductase n=1 Tax=Niveispirillum sp. TaxID=1917217 RepID=UPI001B7ADCB8|nr:FAD-dependent oxidoreductase [Niveispirillum sp.]MBP7338741.1 FAD-dependent oxidoreductase [Niveispirillum sp.]